MPVYGKLITGKEFKSNISQKAAQAFLYYLTIEAVPERSLLYRTELLAGREPTSQRTRVKNDSRKGKSQYLSCVSDVEFNSLPESRKKELKEFSDFLRK